jgi:hypothetical protein
VIGQGNLSSKQNDSFTTKGKHKMATLNSARKCLSCQSKNLHSGTFGYYSHTFMPGKRFMFKGYALQAYVCLDCGTIGSYLNNSDLQDLQKFIEKKKKK